jgi:hypothetical protein
VIRIIKASTLAALRVQARSGRELGRRLVSAELTLAWVDAQRAEAQARYIRLSDAVIGMDGRRAAAEVLRSQTAEAAGVCPAPYAPGGLVPCVAAQKCMRPGECAGRPLNEASTVSVRPAAAPPSNMPQAGTPASPRERTR